MSKENYKLCYVDGHKAWFTSDFEHTTGDDWDDAPYEHNAGDPYDDWAELLEENEDITKRKWKFHKIELKQLYFEFPYELIKLPRFGFCNSPYSVDDINNGDIAWIRGDKFNILGGTTYSDFVKIVQENGGTIYEPIEKIK